MSPAAPSELLALALRAALQPVNALFLVIQLVLFVVALRKTSSSTKTDRDFVRAAPERLTGLGILGTFFGIFLGLIGFDVNNIQGSVPNLLSGMTTAFLTSVAGLFLALVLRVIADHRQGSRPDTASGATIADLYSELHSMRGQAREASAAQVKQLEQIGRTLGGEDQGSLASHLKQLQGALGGQTENSIATHLTRIGRSLGETEGGSVAAQLKQLQAAVGGGGPPLSRHLEHIAQVLGGTEAGSLASHLKQLQEAVGGGGDHTLVTQVRLLRQEQGDAARQMQQQFAEFATRISELSSKALIEALRDVIRDFNEKLSEQFGENFKELNAAVHTLVEWQINHRHELELLREQLTLSTKAIGESRQALAAITGHAAAMQDTMTSLGEVLTSLEAQEQRLGRQLEAYATLGQQAIEAMPTIERNIQQLTEGFSSVVGRRLDELGRAATSQDEATRQLVGSFDKLRQGAEEAATRGERSHLELMQRVQQAHQVLEAQLREVQQRSLQGMQEGLRRAVQDTNEAMSAQLRELDRNMAQEQAKALNQLSQHLLGLHQQLVKDYTPLTAQLRQLIETARRVN